MALFDDRLAQQIIILVRRHYQDIGATLAEPCKHEDVDQLNEASPLRRDLKLLIGVANGEYHRTEEVVRLVEQALMCLQEMLFGNVLSYRTIIPDEFWKTDLGILVSRVRWWIWVDDLITISNAAALAFGQNTQANRMRIGRAIDHGLLEWVPDPSVANPQHNKRVLRPQVERLRDQRRLPDCE